MSTLPSLSASYIGNDNPTQAKAVTNVKHTKLALEYPVVLINTMSKKKAPYSKVGAFQFLQPCAEAQSLMPPQRPVPAATRARAYATAIAFGTTTMLEIAPLIA